MWNRLVLCGILAIMMALIALTVFFIIHNNKSIFGYHKFQKHKNRECAAWMREHQLDKE